MLDFQSWLPLLQFNKNNRSSFEIVSNSMCVCGTPLTHSLTLMRTSKINHSLELNGTLLHLKITDDIKIPDRWNSPFCLCQEF